MAQLIRSVSSSAYDTTYILKKAIPTLEKKLVLGDFAAPAILPPNQGATARWLLDTAIAIGSFTDALTDASGGNITYATRDSVHETAFTGAKVEATIHTYGAFIPVRRQDLKTMPKSMMKRVGSRLAYLGALVKDTLIRAQCDGSGSAFDPSMGSGTTTTRKSIGDGTDNTTISASDKLTAEDLALVAGDLNAVDAEPFSNGMFAAVIHSVPETHLITDVASGRINWQEINKYVSGASGQEKITKGVVGAVAGVMAFRSNNIGQSTVDIANVYENIVFADHGVGELSIDDANPRIIVNKSGPQTVSDPHRMYSTIAFQFEAVPKLLDVNRVALLYSAP